MFRMNSPNPRVNIASVLITFFLIQNQRRVFDRLVKKYFSIALSLLSFTDCKGARI